MIQSRRGLMFTAFAAPNHFGDNGACQGRGANYGTDNFCHRSMRKRAAQLARADVSARRLVPGEWVTELAYRAVKSSGSAPETDFQTRAGSGSELETRTSLMAMRMELPMYRARATMSMLDSETATG